MGEHIESMITGSFNIHHFTFTYIETYNALEESGIVKLK